MMLISLVPVLMRVEIICISSSVSLGDKHWTLKSIIKEVREQRYVNYFFSLPIVILYQTTYNHVNFWNISVCEHVKYVNGKYQKKKTQPKTIIWSIIKLERNIKIIISILRDKLCLKVDHVLVLMPVSIVK